MLPVSGWFPVPKTIIPEAQEHFLTPSARRDTHPFGGLGLKHIYTLQDYTGRGNAGFNVKLSIWWTLDGEWLSRSVDIDGVLMPALGAKVAYEELDRERTAVDQAVAETSGHVMRWIDKRR